MTALDAHRFNFTHVVGSIGDMLWRDQAGHDKTIRRWFGAAGLGLLLAGGVASAQEAVRVRGTIERVEGDVYVVKARDGNTVRLTLAADAQVAASVKSALSDIKPGSYIGVAGMPQADGSKRALEVHIFHESMRGTGEGHRPWDLQPTSTMTNATVDQVVNVMDGRTMTFIVTYLPGSTGASSSTAYW